jgi:two-component system, NtrC family, sensor kinase
LQGKKLKTPIFGLRAGILTQLIFLIIAAMLLINVVILNLYEKDLVTEKEKTGRLLLSGIEYISGNTLKDGEQALKNTHLGADFASIVQEMLDTGEYRGIAIVNGSGESVFSIGLDNDKKQYALTLAMTAMNTIIDSVNYKGSTWGVLWPRKSELYLSSPLKYKGRVIGGISVISSLEPVYEALRSSESLVLIYIAVDTLVLALVGIYLLSRIVVNPIHSLLRMTEEYEDSESILAAGEAPANEIGNLTRALANMLNRLDENKKELKSHIVSLEKANNELKAAQNEIVQSEKLASVGRLAAGIAHEIGNPIGIILGYIDLIMRGGLAPDEEKDFLTRVEGEISRVNIIIRQLLDFSRSSEEERMNLNIHSLITDTVEMLKPQSGMKKIAISMTLNAENDNVVADKNQMQQVFLNILINSIDALSEEGTVMENAYIHVISKNRNGQLELEFIDNGPGISIDKLDHVFDPFFTTKDPGQGTGLGLSVCYRIIQAAKGTIRAESSLGNGMKIRIELPLNDNPDIFSGEPR